MMPTLDLTTAVWRKSTYSDGGANNCLEVADGHPGIVPVRDSKRPDGPVLVFAAGCWGAFLAGVRTEGSTRTRG
ncbi:protein of unknown function [Streptomyces sp. Ag82_O1-12]|uniref:DUF397 domain-containing protein n=1 Tax=Streptomyces TaxID=1883 RepID=UPI000BCAAE09|nr:MULTISPECIES: DUF397 domain-containing protein [Streptomyces]GGV75272.1 hypothetical protein GCM10010228_38500 [Streptomyces massasporeus]SMQ17299.1 protein of unknown function [Streptomyces sp. Ag82_O1-12]SOD46332.1 protein of unknown function [Streptomyces sp. Ag82_G6-1]